ncbi:TPA: hypothetical protein ACL54Y_000661 [Streptococcus pneumoniae]
MVDRTDEVSSKHGFEVVDKEKLMWFEEVFEECKKNIGQLKSKHLTFSDQCSIL